MIVSVLVLEIQRALAIVQPRGFGAVQVSIFSYEEYILLVVENGNLGGAN